VGACAASRHGLIDFSKSNEHNNGLIFDIGKKLMPMYIHAAAYFVPEMEVDNLYFEKKNGLSSEWIVERTGIYTRRRASENENTQTMGIEAFHRLKSKLAFDPAEFDLIVCATYTPFDTIFTMAHALQREIGVEDIPVLTIDTACSSLLNAFEVVEGYFAMGKSSTALVVAADHNTCYSDDMDQVSGHLWGDGAVAFALTKEKIMATDPCIRYVCTAGAATAGKASEGVLLRPGNGGLFMPNGRDVFLHACTYMSQVSRKVLEKNQLTMQDIAWFIPHQANLRITKNVAEQLQVPMEKCISNIQVYGNTGCAGSGIAYAAHQHQFAPSERVLMAVFGGGYSYGACLIEA
jgi:3-oxoacyl-[acyl-carrier-protein] synthase III